MNFHFSRKASLLALLMFVIGVIPVLAQVPTGSIVGTVVDAQKAAIAGADVTITSQDTGVQYKTQTASNGGYAVQSLNFGLYRVDVSKQGFKVASVTNLKLDASSQLSVPPIVLEIGAISQTITVEAGASEVVQTTSASVGNTVDKQQLEDLPIANRQPQGMIQLEPGVTNNGKTGDTTINGQRSAFTSVTLDGINIQDNFIRTSGTDFSPNQLFLSQISEFKINTQNGDPTVGGGSSGISFVSPGGTNAWHGQGFLYYFSNKWAANPWFNNAAHVPNAALNQDQYGGKGGGPVIKDKLFISGSYEELKDLQSTLQESTVFLNAAAQSGMFTYHPTNAPTTTNTVNLLTLEHTNGNVVPGRPNPPNAFTIDPAIAALIARIPANAVPNNTFAGDGLNTSGYEFNASSNAILRNYGFRTDYTANAHHSFSASYYRNRQIFQRPDIDTSFNTVPIVNNFDAIHFFSTAWRWSPNSNLTNEVRFGGDLAPATFDTGQKFGASIITLPTDAGGNPILTNPDPNFFFQGRDTHTWSYQDNANLLHGNHSIIAGMQVQRVTIDAVNNAGTSTNFALGFNGLNPFQLQTSDFPASAPIGGNDLFNANQFLASFVGVIGSTSQTFNVTSPSSGFVPGATQERNLRQNDWSFYLGDAWRYRPNLTITYGMRYEYLSPFNEKNGLYLEPIPGVGQNEVDAMLSNATISFVGGNSGRRPYNKDLHDYAPNIGVAWDPWGNGKTAVRAGYSIHYVNDDLATAVLDTFRMNAGLSTTSGDPSPVETVSGNNGTGLPAGVIVTAPPFGIPTTFAANYANVGGATNNAAGAILSNITTPYVQDWNLSIQHAIGWNTTLTVSYLGNHGTNLIRGIDANQVIIGQNGLLADFNRARNNCFLNLAAPAPEGFCDINQSSVAGTVPLTFINTLPNGGSPNSGTVQADVMSGQVGSLADFYHTRTNTTGPRGIEENAPNTFVPNDLIRIGELLGNFSSSSYNAGVVQVQRRFSRDLIFQGSYVYSKAIDDADGGQSNFLAYLDNAQPRAERARANFDVTHAVKGNFSYNLPFGKGHMLGGNNAIVDRVIGGWTISNVLTWQSGSPFSIFSGRGTLNRAARSANNTAFVGLSRSQLRNDLHISFHNNPSDPLFGVVALIDPSFIGSNGRGSPTLDGLELTCTPLAANGFCNPLPGQLGNLSRNEFNGPMFFDTDISIVKRIPIRESMNLELRGDAFNVINHPTFTFGDQNINSPTFGQVTSTSTSARVIQIGALFNF